jgi:hypothetical protein
MTVFLLGTVPLAMQNCGQDHRGCAGHRCRGRIGPAIAAPALAFSARRHVVEKLSKSGHRFRQQVVRFSLGGMRLVVNKAVENLPVLRKAMSAINDNYLNVQQDILETFVDRGQLRKLAEPTITSTGKRIPGLKLDHPRQLALMHALVRFAHIAAGNTFTTAELHPAVLEALG